ATRRCRGCRRGRVTRVADTVAPGSRQQGGAMPEATIEALRAEGRTFPPPPEFKKTARIVDAEIYDEAESDFEGFWARQAAELLDWTEEWHTILEWNLPFAKWFVGGTLNVSFNCIDRHVAAGHGALVV